MKRLTQPTKLIIDIIKTSTRPLSLFEIHTEAQKTLPMAFSTVFRVVGRLEADQKVTRIDWRERASRFEWAGTVHHHHIQCTGCGAILDLDDRFLHLDVENIQNKTGYLIENHMVELVGLCKNCQTINS